MRALLAWWPLMLKRTHRAAQIENFTLRDALREANNELRKHRALVGGLRAGTIDVVKTLDRMSAQQK